MGVVVVVQKQEGKKENRELGGSLKGTAIWWREKTWEWDREVNRERDKRA